MSNEKKIIILVLSHESDIYQMLENGIRETWANYKNKNIKIFYYYGGNKDSIEGDKIFNNYPDLWNTIGYKTLSTFKKIIDNFDFDYIFRTNSSSYVNIEKLIDYLKDKPINNFYNGIIGHHDGIDFASGCGYTISKDLVVKVLENSDKWPHNIIDDVALSVVLKNLGVYPSLAPRLDVEFLPITNKNLINQHFHFRCKTHTEKRYDVEIMKEIKKILDENINNSGSQ